MNICEELKMKPDELSNVLFDTFYREIPTSFETSEDLNKIGELMAESVNQYSYLTNLLNQAENQWRFLQYDKKNHAKEFYDELDRKTVINRTLDMVKLRQKTLSRLITIKQINNQEISMY